MSVHADSMLHPNPMMTMVSTLTAEEHIHFAGLNIKYQATLIESEPANNRAAQPYEILGGGRAS